MAIVRNVGASVTVKDLARRSFVCPHSRCIVATDCVARNAATCVSVEYGPRAGQNVISAVRLTQKILTGISVDRKAAVATLGLNDVVAARRVI
jgi:hypothetical protein